jgi:hypothetical protein
MKATRRRPTSPLQVLALALVLAGGIGSLLVVAQTSQDAEIGGGACALVAVCGPDRPGHYLVRTVLVPDVDEPATWREQLLRWRRKHEGA